jgi:hypothetical protein
MLLPPLPMPPEACLELLLLLLLLLPSADWMWDLTALSSCLRWRQTSGRF